MLKESFSKLMTDGGGAQKVEQLLKSPRKKDNDFHQAVKENENGAPEVIAWDEIEMRHSLLKYNT